MRVPEISEPVVAFCGIARPEQFFAGLEARGLQVALKKAFGDHHRYTKRDVEGLLEVVDQRRVGRSAYVR